MNDIHESVNRRLFGDSKLSVYAILDGASVPDLLDQLDESRTEHVCLFRGELEPDMQEVAPYLVKIAEATEFAQWVIERGWGNHWGIFALSAEDLRAMRKHFRDAVLVFDRDGKPQYFRFYDPRVLRGYLPNCNGDDLGQFFGPVDSFVVEDGQPDFAIEFRLQAGTLQQQRTALKRKA